MSFLQSLELDKQWVGERMEKVGRSLKILQGIISKEAEAHLSLLEGKQEPLPGCVGETPSLSSLLFVKPIHQSSVSFKNYIEWLIAD